MSIFKLGGRGGLSGSSVMNLGAGGKIEIGGGGRWLPQNLLIGSPVTLEDFEASVGWTPEAGQTIANNTVEFKTGTQSVKFTSTDQAGHSATKTISNTSITTPFNTRVWCYVHDAGFFGVTLYMRNNNGENYFRTTRATPYLNAGWNAIDVSGSESTGDNTGWATIGSPSWAVPFNRLAIRPQPIASNNTAISMDSWQYGIKHIPSICIEFDDADASVYTEAYQYMRQFNMVGTFHVISSQVDGVDKVTTAQLQEMYANGWDIANHTTGTTDLVSGGLTDPQIIAAFTDCKTFLDNAGLTRASAYAAYPSGSYNAAVIADAQAAGMVVCRGGQEYFPMLLPIGNPYYMPLDRVVLNTDSLASVKARADNAVVYNRISTVLFHQIVTTPTTAIQFSIANFRAFIDHVRTLGLQTLTVSEMYRLQSGGITVTHN